MRYEIRAFQQLTECISFAREVAREGAALPKGCPRERQLAEIAGELGAMIETLGADLEISPDHLLAMIRAPFEHEGRLN